MYQRERNVIDMNMDYISPDVVIHFAGDPNIFALCGNANWSRRGATSILVCSSFSRSLREPPLVALIPFREKVPMINEMALQSRQNPRAWSIRNLIPIAYSSYLFGETTNSCQLKFAC